LDTAPVRGDWEEALRRGPVLSRIGDAPVLVLGPKSDGLATFDLSTKHMRDVTVAEAPEAIGLQVFRRVEVEESTEAFGWKWFAKAFFSNKQAIRDALVTSLVIQLIALAFPLATQAVVDKVITNQAQSTLVVLGVGIALFAVFSAALSFLRQKLMLRLANAIDGRLAQQVFDRLVRLPLPFFEQRATGVIINRIHGVERVREFFAGALGGPRASLHVHLLGADAELQPRALRRGRHLPGAHGRNEFFDWAAAARQVQQAEPAWSKAAGFHDRAGCCV
jgi:ABC-type bacteriocin/lantibiotic exporter with double-glycine peptidase domain